MSSEYFDHIKPVAVTAHCMGVDTWSGSRERSDKLAMLMPHLNVGAQKKIVFGPAGWFKKALKFAPNDAMARA